MHFNSWMWLTFLPPVILNVCVIMCWLLLPGQLFLFEELPEGHVTHVRTNTGTGEEEPVVNVSISQ